MAKLTLYLMVGYPGAGKTTTARVLHKITGAEHLWADHERRRRYSTPTYSHTENLELYDHLNQVAKSKLEQGQSVIFDTNFNFHKDRERLRNLASKQGAQTILVWLKTPKDLAKQRATSDAHTQDTRILGNMPEADFERMSNNLEPPRENEVYIEIDGTNVSEQHVRQQLENNQNV